MAIIDILTPYDAKKKAAHAAKTVKHGVSPSCCLQAPCSETPRPPRPTQAPYCSPCQVVCLVDIPWFSGRQKSFCGFSLLAGH